MTTRSLTTYLNDHLAGAAGGTELAAKLAHDLAGTALAGTLDTLHHDIVADQRTLLAVMDAVGARRSRWKQATGWALEKASRLKFSASVAGDADYGTMLRLETLAAGVDAKQAMWQALRRLGNDSGRFAGIDMDELAQRASQQRATIEDHRLAAAARAFDAD